MFSKSKIIVAISTLVFTSCGGGKIDDQISSLETILGQGWVCHSSPSSDQKAGMILVIKDGVTYPEGDKREKAKSYTSAIGDTSYQLESTYGGVLRLLKDSGILDAGASATAQLNKEYKLDAKFGDTKKWVLLGDDVRDIEEEYKNKNLSLDSQYVIIRESQSARSINTYIEKSVVGELGANLDIDTIVNVNPKISDNGGSTYKIDDTFDEDLGICTKTYTLNVKQGIDGTRKVSLGEIYELPRNLEVK